MLHILETLLWTVPTFALLITILVFVHEYGHYLAARIFGVRVIAFSIGMGKEITHRIDKNGVRWRVGLFPIGGYVKFAGDDNIASTTQTTPEQGGLPDHPLIVRTIVVAAGPLANILLAFMISTGIFAVNGRWLQPPAITAILPNSPAEHAGLKPKDTIIAIDGVNISTFTELATVIQTEGDVEHTISYLRDGALNVTRLTPRFVIVDQGAFGRNSVAQIGISVTAGKDVMRHETCRLAECAAWGAEAIASNTFATLAYFKSLALGRQSADGLAGPVGIAASAGEIAKTDPATLIAFLSMLSLSIGIMNLLPIPVLDGGHLAFYLYEAIARRPPSPRVVNFATEFGMRLLIVFIAYVTVHDLMKHILS